MKAREDIRFMKKFVTIKMLACYTALTALILAVCFAYTPSQAVAAGADAGMYYEVIANACIREKPDKSSRQIGTAKKGSVVLMLDVKADPDYSMVSFDGETGYIFTGCIKAAEKDAPAGGTKTMLGGNPATGTKVMTASDAWVIAKEKGLTEFEAPVKFVMTSSDAWSVANEKGLTVMVSMEPAAQAGAAPSRKAGLGVLSALMGAGAGINLDSMVYQADSSAETETPKAQLAETAHINEVVYRTARYVKMYEKPDSKSDVMMSIPEGMTILVFGSGEGEYCRIAYNGKSGYIKTDAITDNTKDVNAGGGELFEVTAYCPCRICCQKYSNELNGGEPHTATGTVPEAGRTIAVDPTVIPYGSVVEIEGLGTFIAEDCGGKIKENHIDVYFNTHEEAKAFGKKMLHVIVVQ